MPCGGILGAVCPENYFCQFPVSAACGEGDMQGSVFSLNRMDRARGNYSGYVAAMAKPMEIRAWQSGQAPQSPPLVAASAKMRSAAREAYLHVKTANIANIPKMRIADALIVLASVPHSRHR